MFCIPKNTKVEIIKTFVWTCLSLIRASRLVDCKHWYLGFRQTKVHFKFRRPKWLGVRPCTTCNVCVTKSVARSLYSNSSSFFTQRLRQSCHKNTRHERNCIPGMLNSVPFRTAALGTAQKKKKKMGRQFSVMGPNIINIASQTNRVRLGGCIKLHYGGAVFFFFFFFFRGAVSSLTRAFSLHKIHIYWNKRKGSHNKDRSGPLSEISASRTEISLSAHHFT